MNNYHIFAQVYDVLMSEYDYEKVYNWVKGQLKLMKIVPQSILEMACGTASLTEKIVEIAPVDAFDLSQDMLVEAQKKLENTKDVQLFQLDMRDFNMHKSYDLILCLCDSLNYISNESEIDRVFCQVSKHLNRGGVFLFDLNTAYNFKENFGQNAFIFDEEEVFCSWDNFYDEELGENHYHLDIFKPENGLYRRYSEDHIEYIYKNDTIVNLLEKNGLKIISINNGYSNQCNLEQSLRNTFTVVKESL